MTCLIDTSWASVAVPGIDILEENPDRRQPSRLEIEGTEGTLLLKADRSLNLFTDTEHRQWQFPRETRHNSFVAAQQHFIDCLESGAEFETSGSETLRTMALVYACYRSAEEARPVGPGEFL